MKLIDMLVEDGLNGWRWPEGAEKATSYMHIRGVHFWDGVGHRVDYRDLTTRELSCEAVTREQYEAAMAAKNDGWIEWGGGECPVNGDALVEVKYRNGTVNPAEPAKFYIWTNGYGSCRTNDADIIAYRLHKPQEAEQAEADKADMNECISQDSAPVWNGAGLPPVGCFCEVEDLDGMLVYGQGESGEVIAHVENTAVIRMSYGLGCFEARFLRPLCTKAERKRDAVVEQMIKIATIYTTKSLSLDLALNSIYNAIAAGEITGVKLED